MSVFWKVASGSELSGVNDWVTGGIGPMMRVVGGKGWPIWQSVAAWGTCVEGRVGNSWRESGLGGCVGPLCALCFLVCFVEGRFSWGPISSDSSVRGSSGMIGMGGIGLCGDLWWSCVFCWAAGGCLV